MLILGWAGRSVCNVAAFSLAFRTASATSFGRSVSLLRLLLTISRLLRRVTFIASRVYDLHFSAKSLGRAVFLIFITRRLIPRQCLQQHIAAHPPLRVRPEGRC